MRKLRCHINILLFTGMLSCAATMPSLGQDINCDEAITISNESFFNAKFEEATTTLKYCLSTDSFTKIDEAHALLAQIYFAIEEYELSTTAILTLLDVVPEYELPGSLPPPFVIFFERTRNIHIRHEALAAKLRPAPEYKRKQGLRNIDSNLYWIGAGVLVAGTAAILLDGGSRPVAFAPPPGPPGGEPSNSNE